MLYSLKEITIVPTKISDIDSRSECNPYYENEYKRLPLFTAPMSAVVGVNSWKDYMNNKINPIIPRNIPIEKRLNLLSNTTMFVSFSLSEIQQQFIDKDYTDYNGQFHILIDIANGNMKKMFDLVKQLKKEYSNNVIIMAGNIANPYTYEEYCKAGIDYCRVGIGGGAGCLTTTMTGIHYPLGSLLMECNYIKQEYHNPTKIVADGGIKGYSDIIKCLALGADYVMIGGLFASAYESAATITNKETLTEYPIILDASEEIKKELILRNKFIKSFYGMASKQGKVDLGTKGTAEGIEKTFEVTYTLKQWIENMEDYLRSAMSYCDTFTLEEFIGTPSLIINSTSEQLSINK